VNHRKPRVQTPVMSRYPTPAPVHDFVLLFLPPCGLHLTPLGTGSLESGLLVSPLLGGPARHRTFVPSLHLHQSKSSCNLHLQYLARVSPHHVVNHSSQPGAAIHRSSDAPVLSGSTTHRPDAPALLRLCRASGRVVSSVGCTGSHRAPDHYISRLNYSPPSCTGPTAPMSCIRMRGLVARLIVGWSHWLSPCAWPLHLTTGLLATWLHRLYCTYVVHPNAPSRCSTSHRSVALALIVYLVTTSRGSTTHRSIAPALLNLSRAFGRAVLPLDNSTLIASTVCLGSKAKSFI
jgi:hypothetical protein